MTQSVPQTQHEHAHDDHGISDEPRPARWCGFGLIAARLPAIVPRVVVACAAQAKSRSPSAARLAGTGSGRPSRRARRRCRRATADEVRDQELRDRERDAGDQDRRPDLEHRLAQPAKAQISQNGTISEKNGSWRPTIAPSSIRSKPVTLASVMIGVPSAPKATGAVLAISDRPDGRERREAEADQDAPRSRRPACRSRPRPRRTRRSRTRSAAAAAAGPR